MLSFLDSWPVCDMLLGRFLPNKSLPSKRLAFCSIYLLKVWLQKNHETRILGCVSFSSFFVPKDSCFESRGGWKPLLYPGISPSSSSNDPPKVSKGEDIGRCLETIHVSETKWLMAQFPHFFCDMKFSKIFF